MPVPWILWDRGNPFTKYHGHSSIQASPTNLLRCLTRTATIIALAHRRQINRDSDGGGRWPDGACGAIDEVSL